MGAGGAEGTGGATASRLQPLVQKYSSELVIIMRVYFEKPRTTVGWKGMINDPDLDGSYHINKGLRLAREVSLPSTPLSPCSFPSSLLPT